MTHALPILGGEIETPNTPGHCLPEDRLRSLSLKRTRIMCVLEEYDQELSECHREVKRLAAALESVTKEKQELAQRLSIIAASTAHTNIITSTTTPLSESRILLEDSEENPFLDDSDSTTATGVQTRHMQQIIAQLQYENSKLKKDLKIQPQPSAENRRETSPEAPHPSVSSLAPPTTPSKNAAVASSAFKMRITELERENANLNAALVRSDEYIERLMKDRS
ncbi:hypothetical protein HDU98_007762 [Podochytrium sp. JEL0797]|nr:hypothetical protein HDU98_007762 [Podochytrium sp. JEL0797]